MEVIEARLRGRNIYIEAGKDIWIEGGAKIIAEEKIEIKAGNEIQMKPGQEYFMQKGESGGISISFGGGTLIGVGVDGEKHWAESLWNKHNELKAGSKLILRSAEGQYIVGSVVEAPEIEVSGKSLLIESVLDTSESHSIGGGFDTTGSAHFHKSDSESAWVNTVSGLYATESMTVNIEEGIELVGAVINGPEGNTYIESETFHYRDLSEFENSKSIAGGISLTWDKQNVGYGSIFPAMVDINYHHDAFEGITRATVAGEDVEGSDPLHVEDLLNSDDLNNLNRDRDNVQERWQTKNKHIRVYLPIADLKQIWEDVFGGTEKRVVSADDVDEAVEKKIQERQEIEGEDPNVSDSATKKPLIVPIVSDPDADTKESAPAAGILPQNILNTKGEEVIKIRTFVGTEEAENGVFENEKKVDVNYSTGGSTLVVSIDKEKAQEYKFYPGKEELERGLTAKDWIDIIFSKEVLMAAIDGGNRYAGALMNGVVQGANDLVKGAGHLLFGGISNGVIFLLDDPIEFLSKTSDAIEGVAVKTVDALYMPFTSKFYQRDDLPEVVGGTIGRGAFDLALAYYTAGTSRGAMAAEISGEISAQNIPKTIANSLPNNLEFARVIKPDQVDRILAKKEVRLSSFVDGDGVFASEAFITTSESLPKGMTKKQLAEMLTIREGNVGAIIRFKLNGKDLDNLATPYNRFEMEGFVNGGRTDGGLAEYVMPNREIKTLQYEIEYLD